MMLLYIKLGMVKAQHHQHVPEKISCDLQQECSQKLVYLLHNKVVCHNAESPRLLKMKAFIQTAPPLYCLF